MTATRGGQHVGFQGRAETFRAEREAPVSCRFLASLAPMQLARWLRTYLRDGEAGDLAGELTRDNPEVFVESLASRRQLRETGVPPDQRDVFVEERLPRALALLIHKWVPSEGFEYFGALIRLAAFFGVSAALDDLRSRFADVRLRRVLEAEAPEIHVDLLGTLIELTYTANQVDLRRDLLAACRSTYLQQPLYAALCFRCLAREYPDEVDSAFLPALAFASWENKNLRLHFLLREYFDSAPGVLVDPKRIGYTLDQLMSIHPQPQYPDTMHQFVLHLFEELFIAGVFVVPRYPAPYFCSYADEPCGLALYRTASGSALAFLCEVDSKYVPGVWQHADCALWDALLGRIRGFVIDFDVQVGAILRRGGHVQVPGREGTL